MKQLKEIIKRIIGENLKNRIKYLFGFKYYDYFKEYKNKKKIIHFLTPLHGNMGDQAIVYATNEFLRNSYPEYEIIEVYREDLYKYGKAIKKIMTDDDFIVLIGGGNMGNLWINEERDRRFVIEKFKNNKIVSMPQTISFTNDNDGSREFEKTKKIYNLHKNLTIIARENKSFKIMKENFYNANVIINPDIVLYLHNRYGINKNRNGIMTCIRNDKESVLGKRKNKLMEDLDIKFSNVVNYDTVIDKVVTRENREKELESMFNKFIKMELVITDRLHGMVFAAITKTPCIVTKSLDHKVTGTYEWIKELNYIKLVDNLDFDTIKPLIEELRNINEFDNIDLNTKYFSSLKQIL